MVNEQRNFGLDLVRAIAVVVVVFYHGEPILQMVPRLRHIYTYFEIDGVPIFFVLSGFLIGGILLRKINAGFTFSELYKFWIRRWFRTLPNYYFVLLFLISYYFLMEISIPSGLYKYFFFLQNFNTPQPEFFGVSWSLTVEEWFYLLVPFLLFMAIQIFPHRNKEVVLFCIIGVIIFTTIFRMYRVNIWHYTTLEEWDLSLRKQVVTRLDSIMFGFLGAYIHRFNIRFWNRYKNYLFVIGMMLLIGPNIYYMVSDERLFTMFIRNYFLITVVPIGTLFILPKITSIEKCTWKGAKAVTFISIISYSIYLLHTIIANILLPHIFRFVELPIVSSNYKLIAAQYTLYWVLSILFAWLLYAFYEKPMTNLRERFSKA